MFVVFLSKCYLVIFFYYVNVEYVFVMRCVYVCTTFVFIYESMYKNVYTAKKARNTISSGFQEC